jgi:hypothetical protein
MPVFDEVPNSPIATPVPATIQISKPAYRGVVVDTTLIPQQSLLTNIEGMSWTVDYFSQVIDEDNALTGQSVDKEGIYQQYRRIQNLEIKVSQDLKSTQDNSQKTQAVTGNATMYPFVVPNEGDMFVVTLLDGRAGICQITHSEERSIYKDTCYYIEYILVDEATKERMSDLVSKTVQNLYFLRDFLIHGQNPLIQEEDWHDLNELSDRYRDLVTMYFKMFSSNEYKTLVLPGQPEPTYDHFVMKAVMKFFTTWDTYLIRQNRILNCDDDDVMKSITIWDALVNRDDHLMKFVNKRAGLVPACLFTRNAMLEGIHYSGIRRVVYPIDPELTVDFAALPAVKSADGTIALSPVQSRKGTLKDLLDPSQEQGLQVYGNAPLINPVLCDDYYVFSEAFYNNYPDGQSKLELCVRDFLQGKAINRKLLLQFCDTYHAWGGLERFYYLPVVLVLINAATRAV